MSDGPLDLVLAKLTGVTEPNASGWYEAFCPAHDDRRRSLGIRAGNTGAVILKCQASCQTTAVVAALGLRMADLSPPTPNGTQPRPRIVASYNYTDEQGALVFQVVRFDPKQFRQRRPDGCGGWVWSLAGIRRVLYRVSELLAADPSTTVYVVEGEKDADVLRALGLVATTNPGG